LEVAPPVTQPAAAYPPAVAAAAATCLIQAPSPYTLSYTVLLHWFAGPRDTVPITRPSESIAGPPESPSHVPFCAVAPPSHSCVWL
jgi:hypothetical protein